MSDSATPQDFSFAARDVILNMTLMETFGDGIYSAIFWFTMYMLVFGKREKGSRLSFSTFIVLVPMYILSMIHLAIRWFTLRYAFVVKGDTSDDVLNGFLQQPRWCSVLSVVSFSLMSLIADFVAVWRCWMIWNRSWKVALLPILIVLAGVAFCIISAIYQIDPNSNLASDNFNKFAQSSLIYFCLSLASTVISTTLIVYRIIAVARDTGFQLESPYKKALEIIVESAALYSIALIIYLPFLTRDDFSDGYSQAVLICITAIAPTIITARVTLGVSRDYSTVQKTKDSSMFIVANNTTTTQTSRTVHGSNNELNSLSSEKKEESSNYDV